MTQVNDILTSPDEERPPLRVVGADTATGRWIVSDDDEFDSGPRVLEDEEAAAYNVADAPVKGDEVRGWQEFGKRHAERHNEEVRRVLRDRPLTPTQALEQGHATPVTFQIDGRTFVDGSAEAEEVLSTPLKRAREAAGLTQASLAEKACVSERSIIRAEHPDPRYQDEVGDFTWRRIGKALGVEVDAIRPL